MYRVIRKYALDNYHWRYGRLTAFSVHTEQPTLNMIFLYRIAILCEPDMRKTSVSFQNPVKRELKRFIRIMSK